MTTGIQLIEELIRRKLPRAKVAVYSASQGYTVSVVSESFLGVPRADREARIYNALDKAPLELVAKISVINCQDR